MANGLERFKYSRKGYLAIMKSPEVLDVLEDRANRVANALAAAYPDPDWEIVVDPYVGATRANVVVSGVPARVEEADRILGAALTAARP